MINSNFGSPWGGQPVNPSSWSSPSYAPQEGAGAEPGYPEDYVGYGDRRPPMSPWMEAGGPGGGQTAMQQMIEQAQQQLMLNSQQMLASMGMGGLSPGGGLYSQQQIPIIDPVYGAMEPLQPGQSYIMNPGQPPLKYDIFGPAPIQWVSNSEDRQNIYQQRDYNTGMRNYSRYNNYGGNNGYNNYGGYANGNYMPNYGRMPGFNQGGYGNYYGGVPQFSNYPTQRFQTPPATA